MQKEEKMSSLIPIERIEDKIYLIRGHKVMLDQDLAELYGIETKAFNQSVKRNAERFPADFMFQLNWAEAELSKKEANLRSQTVTSKYGGRRYLPYAFTENGVAMLSSILSSKQAIEINIQIMRAFTRLRQIIAANKDLSYLFNKLKHKVDQHDVEIGLIILAIEKMIAVDTKPRAKIGFVTGKEER